MHLLTSWAAPRGVWDSDHSEGVANTVVKTNECQYPPEHLPPLQVCGGRSQHSRKLVQGRR